MSYRTLAGAALLAAALGLGSGGTASAQQCTVKVGVALPTSVDWGQPIARTAQFATELANEAGGVHGCRVEPILRDTQADPKVGVDAAKALVDLEGVRVLLGAVSSGVSMPILTSVTVPSGVMQMSCCSSSTAFTRLAQEGGTNGLWFRTFATTRVQTSVAAMVARDQGYESIAIFYKNDDWGQDVAEFVRADFEAVGLTVTASVAINDGQPSYRAEVTDALRDRPQAIYMALYPKEGTQVAREWISLGGTQEMIVANSLKSDEFRQGVGMRYLGDLRGTDTSSPRTDSAAAFRALYRDRFDAEPNGPGIPNSFDATLIALLAMHAAGEGASGAQIAAKVPMVTDPAGTPVAADAEGFARARALLDAGTPVSYQGATGAVRFDGNGDVSAPAVIWSFTGDGVTEDRFVPLAEVDAFIATLN